MYHFIYAIKDSWITSGSDHTINTEFKEQNYGQDQILEIKKQFWNSSFDYSTRALVQFNLNESGNSISQSCVDGKIINPSFFLRLYGTEGNSQLSTDYTLAAQPLSQSWDEGVGKFDSSPIIKIGVSWLNRNNYPGSTATTWSLSTGAESGGGATYNVSQSSQTFSYESPDIEMNITNMVKAWLSGSDKPAGINNHGLVLRFSGSQETDTQTYGQLKFFSSQTNTIYAPKLEVRWDDHSSATDANTGSLNQITMSGADENYVYPIGLKSTYKESEKSKFRFGVRKRYIQKTFSTSYQTLTGSFIAEGSGSYSVVDVATGESIVPFSDYTLVSCDSTSPYFNQWLNGFSPDRIYRVLIKIKYDDGQEVIYSDGFEFKVVN